MPLHLPSRRHERANDGLTVDQSAVVALTACVRRACGLPSSTLVGQRASPVSAFVVGDPTSGSRAVLLRLGASKRDAVLWVSPRGGLLCSCFGGTQNALLLSVSSRSSDCKHVRLLRAALAAARVPLSKFQARMQLVVGAKNYAVCRQYGTSAVWVVLYQRVYSLVNFSAANVASCVAPCCRRFRGRCGHVKFSRPLHSKRLAELGAASAERRAAGMVVKAPSAVSTRRRFLSSEDEDEGIEKLPSDTSRDKGDSPEEMVAARNPRNLLPCRGEMADAEVWARTSDWEAIRSKPAAALKPGISDDRKLLMDLFQVSLRLGHIRDVSEVLVERHCGSCGTERGADVQVTPERAIIYTHHPSAPAIEVRRPLIMGREGPMCIYNCGRLATPCAPAHGF